MKVRQERRTINCPRLAQSEVVVVVEFRASRFHQGKPGRRQVLDTSSLRHLLHTRTVRSEPFLIIRTYACRGNPKNAHSGASGKDIGIRMSRSHRSCVLSISTSSNMRLKD